MILRARRSWDAVGWRWMLGVLLLGTLLKGIIWSFVVPPFDAPDEPSHFNYVMQIRSQHSLPVVVMDAPTNLRIPPSTPVDAASASLFARYGYTGFEAMPYESTQPPLYYFVAALLTAPLPEDRLLL